MKKLTNKKDIHRLTLLFAAAYMISYITRINYGAIIAEMENTTGFTRSMLSMALTGSFFTYGAGQVISGICGDRFSPKKLVSCGFTLTVLMNLLIPLCQNPYQMLAVWCINGFAQSFLWPPLVRLMTVLLSDEDYKNSMPKISWGASFGTIFVYLLSPLFISGFGWKSVFFFSALCGIVMIFVWNRYCYEIEKEQPNTEIRSGSEKKTPLFSGIMIFIMLAIILKGMLRDGVTTWMPSYISETYHLSSSISILTGVVLPLFSIACYQLATTLYTKKFKNPVLCAGAFFAVGAAAALALFLLSGQNAAFSVLFSAVLTGCMHAVSIMLTGMLPPFFRKNGNVSTVSGILNSCTYIGSAISSYGIAVLSENTGWRYTLLLWLAIAVAGTVICLLCAKHSAFTSE